MSHFSVLVITPGPPTDESLKAALQPWHEYECTGTEDQYVVDVDVTDELNENWAKMVEVVRMPDGTIFSRYDSRFYTKDGELGWDNQPRKEFELPTDCKLEEVPQSVLSGSKGQTQQQYAEDYGGWLLRDGRYYDRTNPNAKWDWWTVGGRYSGKFAAGYDPEKDPAHQEPCPICRGSGKRTDVVVPNGCNGCEGTGRRTMWPTQWTNTLGNQIRVGDIAWDALRQAQVDRWLAEYDKAAAAVSGLPLPPKWDDLRDQIGDINKAREVYHDYPAVKAIKAAGFWDANEIVEKLKVSRDEHAAKAARRPVTCWAIVHEGKWYESGSMGWWGMSSNDKDPDEWTGQVNKLLESLPPDNWITCVDCHI